MYHSLNIFRVIKSRIIRWTGHIARKYEGRNPLKIVTSKFTVKRPVRTPGVDVRTILEWILKKFVPIRGT